MSGHSSDRPQGSDEGHTGGEASANTQQRQRSTEGRGCRWGQKTGDDKNKAPQRSLWTLLSHFPHQPLWRDDCQLYFIDRNIITDRENDRPKSHGRVYVPTLAVGGEGGS